MEKYTTVFEEATAEYEEKRSRFIATLRHCESEQEAKSFIDEMRSKYWDARHNCFAFVTEKGRLCRFSDDGEPQGTAGKPILEVISGSGVVDIAVVVTRYFGGTLLGTGGLVRAYTKATQDALANAKKVEMVPCTVYGVECEYADHQKLVYLIENTFGDVVDTQFADKITLQVAYRDEHAEAFLSKLRETFSARLQALEIQRKMVGF